MDYSPSLASIVEGAMKSEAGHFEDTLTPVPEGGTVVLSIPTEIGALAGGSLMQVRKVIRDATHTTVSGAEILFTTNPDDSVCFVKEIVSEHPADEPLKGTTLVDRPLGGAYTSYKEYGLLTPDHISSDGEHNTFGAFIHAVKVWVEGNSIKIELHNPSLEDDGVVDVFLTYLVFGS